jgi:simple sugar transport system ATP-binding protein
MESDKAQLKVESVSKRFGSLEALKPLSVTFLAGEVHAVVGENGAGKSTLMNILGGFLSPTSGKVQLNGTDLPVSNPQKCRALGIEMIHQHFKLVPAFTVRENLRLSQLGVGKTNIEEIEQKAKEFGWSIPWETKVQDISVGTQQRVEILKSVATNPQVLIFDEPTAVLSETEVSELIRFLKSMAKQGKIVILIAHKIEEVLSASDRITVLRRGEHIGTVLREEIQSNQLVEMMVGSQVGPSTKTQAFDSSKGSALKITSSSVSFEVREGSIVGIGGVDGNGQVELAEALAGIDKQRKVSISIDDNKLDYDQVYVGYVPQDRHMDGLAMDLNLVENMAVSGLVNHRPFSASKQSSNAQTLIGKFSIKAKSPRDKARQLSGGNQQKVILARVLDQNPKVLIIVNPTRGLDVKAAQFVHQQVQDAAKNGAYIIVFTTDRDELFSLTDEQWFMSRSKLYRDEKEALTA